MATLKLTQNPNLVMGAYGRPIVNGSPGTPGPVMHSSTPVNIGGLRIQAPTPAPVQAPPQFHAPLNITNLFNHAANIPLATFGLPSPLSLRSLTRYAIRPTVRGGVEIPTSVTGKTFHSGNPLEQALLGTQPVAPVQKDVKGVYRAVKTGNQTLPGGVKVPAALAGPAAAADAVLHIAQDVPSIGTAVKGGKVLVTAAKDLKPLNEVGAVGKDVSKIAPKVTVVKKPVEVKPNLTPTPAGKVSAFDTAVRSSQGVLNKIDPRLGAAVHQRREIAETSAAVAKNKLKVTNSLSKEEQTNMVDVLEGKASPINTRVRQAADESKKALNEVYFKAKAVGVKLPGYRKNYFPHIHNPKVFAKGSPQHTDAVQHLINTKQAKNEADAIKLIRHFGDSSRVSAYQNLAKHRALDLPGYAKNKEALHQYLDRAYATIAHNKVFGKDDKVLNKIFADIRKNGGDYEQAIKSYRQASGLTKGSEVGEKTSRVLTNIQGSTKLGASFIGNASQQANNVIVGGLGRTVKSLATMRNAANKEFVAKTGVTDEQVAHEALFGEQGVSKKMRNITAPLFEPVEKANRATSALVGRDLANSLAKKALKGNTRAADRLRDEFGITKIPKKGLSEADQIKAARSMVERTQFRTGPQDLPGWASTPTGRVVSQFKRYPYKQAQFIKHEIINPTLKGNPLPLIRAGAVGAPVGLATNYVQDKVRGVNFKQSAPEKAIDIANTVTGANLATSLAQQLYPNSHDANSYISKVLKAIGGPTVSDVVKGVGAGFDAAKGKATNAERFALGHVPVVGTPASSRLLPYPDTTSTKVAGAPGTVNNDGTTNLTTTQRIKQAFSTKDGQAFLKLTDDQKRRAAETDPNTAELYKEWQGAKSALKEMPLHSTTDPASISVIDRNARLTTAGKAAYNDRHPEADYETALAKYNDDKAAGKLTQAQDIKAQFSLAKAAVGKDFEKQTRDLYGLNKSEIYGLITSDPQGNEMAKKLVAYDQALYKAGLISTPKFKNGFTPSTGGSGSRSVSAGFAAKYLSGAKAVKAPSLPKGITVSHPSVTVRGRSSSIGKKVKVTRRRVA